MKMKIKKGFSLLELTLVLGVGTMVAFMKFQDMKNEQESIMASAVGQQMKQIGEAVNGYINIRYDKLSTLSNAAGTGTDPGPRTCSGSVCEITYQTLINEGLLPSTYTGTNANKSSYRIILKRDGTSPYFVINGLITTSTAWIEGGKTRYDLLGNAMQTAGIDSGMTRTTSNAFGYGGQWTENSSNFNNITIVGQLAYRVGFNSALYSIYLRRDGTLPMTGNLNMGGKNINNVQDITADGTIDASYLKSMRLYVTNESDLGTLTTRGRASIGGDLNVSGIASLQKSLYATSYIQTGSYIKANGDITSNSALKGLSVSSSYNIDSVYGKIQAGGDAMPTKSKAYLDSDGSIYASGNINGQTIISNGRLTSDEFIQINGVSTVGAGCSPNGLVGRDVSGGILSCQSGVWRRNAGSTVLTGLIGNAQQIPLPTGFSQNQCTWSVSNSENPHGWKPNYFAGQVAAVDANRVVTCGYYDEYVFHPGTNRTDLTGKCSFVISCS
ncbi:TPA: shufflon system plasmid conjugative transfer pilus tip adhesin PilV [Escherichia coli]